MILEFVIVPAIAGALLLTAIWRVLDSVALAQHWPSWAPIACIAAAIAALAVLAVIRSVIDEVRMRRERRELSVMEQRYPGCHVLRLSSGEWFLTDRATGREFEPDDGPVHSFKSGKTRDAGTAAATPQPAQDTPDT
ncbi:hypothetical protein R69746_06516 [Paraburkholderia aspalathi]|uniref:hypothetical protein n=1 Tax=Paraburkholderia aspalathi TaxID=1324617 RepID=UPI00190AB061|nr:hypothetical protein [Paraburkholderia aspalathi]MBK3842444.1 hypothetical protein [Paraburkholderia aspalathi]CAE6831374.1 hypothetical protein R69746_06516 [Paraburkholderia aspalathi]